jgi:cytochrome c biogenesis protein CcdA
MLGLDDHIADLGAGSGVLVALAVALLLGLRHATDPDHLTAVSTLVAGERRGGGRRAVRLGLSWGLGHAASLFALGLPVALLGSQLPEPVRSAAETAVGLVIVALGLRLLVRWQRGCFHAHPHRHGEVVHAHPHVHEHAGRAHPAAHEHAHPEALGRTRAEAFAIGLVHGVGGSAGIGIILVGALAGGWEAVLALAVFAAGTALSMALASAAFGVALTRGPLARRMEAFAPVCGVGALAFGCWYVLGALGTVPYAF